MPSTTAGGFDRRAPVAIVDLGSNSGRVVVYALDPFGQLRLRASSRAALRLVREVDSARRLGPQALERTLAALRDFRAIARGAGAARLCAVATGAARDATDGAQLLERARRELAIRLEIIDGEREAHYGFLGALHGLPVEHGLLFDLGGGSLQLTRFRGRKRVRAVSLPLGALRLSQAFLPGDPPEPEGIRRLRRHVRRLLERAQVEPLRAGEELVGTGGTLRNLAKVDRHAHGYPITRVHGYELGRRRVREIARLLAARRLRKRDTLAGLSDERGDSIVGGAFAIATLMEVCRARRVHVSGQGLREGLAFSLLSDQVPSVAEVRTASLLSLASRFDGWDAAAAERRAGVALRLARARPPGETQELTDALAAAARLLDLGRSVDFFDRHEHAADIVLASEMNGYAHRELALLSAVLRRAGDENADELRLRPLLHEDDRPGIERAAVLLALADDLEERCPRGARIELACRATPTTFTIACPTLGAWRRRHLDQRFERTFGRRLVVRPGTD